MLTKPTTMEKTTQYQPVAHDESMSISELEGNVMLTRDLKRARWNSRLRALLQLLGAVILVSAYTVAVLTIARRMGGKEETSDLGIIRSPAADYVEYEVREVDYLDWEETDAFFGPPSKTVDGNWHKLMKYHNIGLPKSYMEEVGRLDQGVKFPDGRYFGSMMAFHHLHCLKHIYHTLHPEHYGISKKTGEEERQWTRHTAHCLGAMKAYIMCKADTTIETMKWDPVKTLPLHNVTSTHQCVKWDSIMDYAGSNNVDIFAEGILVHPNLGPLFKGGKPVYPMKH